MENSKEEKVAVPQQHHVKLYIMLPCGHQGYMYVNAERCTAIRRFLPTREILETHFETQYVLRQKAAYEKQPFRPMPLFLQLQSAIFADACEELISKYGRIRKNELRGGIALTLGGPIPCCILTAEADNNEPIKQ